ncbi:MULTISPECIES: restriction endonuclease subunit S [unclassified Campylobacter]|uniref:restriction endonuclease subunit S n=1 Tax=unclassified Campylobacter TaxID=2593542 RepID=UPI0022EA0792|nr:MULTISPECIES: restriction endonuclease subunit S [unclassified Campylobacter]MDA3056507.1 restriction endonuclease subunit S [Campylobacter sp. CN_NA1]MDA3082863.1 restriction endonuclease subunit S [Campylobacter sp. CN_EL2]MDA3087361.1 restriction endonuclease subunit S [Campylobacter sp. CN_NA2]MDA3088667.1 restriction endonuclease subunit S [Campylobacter sp. CN_EL1]
MALNLNQTLQNKYPNLEMSVLKMSEVKENKYLRLDDEYYQKDYLLLDKNINKYGYRKLSDISKQITDFGAFSQTNMLNFIDNGVLFLRNQDIKESYIDLSNNVYIYKHIYDKLTLHLQENDILIPRVGTLGNAAIVKKEMLPCSANQNLAVVRLLDEVNPYVVILLLVSCIGKKQIDRLSTGNVQQWLNLEAIGNLKIPIFPLSFQQEIEEMVKTSHECLEQSKDLYREAEVLLYQELGLNPQNPLSTIAPVSQSLNFSVRTLKESLHTTGRLDSEYYQIKYDEILRLIKNQRFAKLSDLVYMQKSIEPGSEAYQENGIPFIRVSNFNKFGISDTDIFLDFAEFSQTIKPKKETILLSKDGSIGTAYCVKDDGDFITSSALLHLNIKNEKSKEILPEYLTLILNSVLVKLQAERDSGGSIIAHWRINEIEEILIPILDISIQEKIENLIKQSFALRVRANELLQSAKTKVETAIERA